MKKIIAVLFPILLLALFVLIMVSSAFLKKPFGDQDDVLSILDDIRSDVVTGNWPDAKTGTERLDQAWEIITDRVQFSAERDELRDARTSIARMKGYIDANDQAGSLAELGEVEEHWADLGQ